MTAELGDYDPEIHTPSFVSEFRFTPEQTEEMEILTLEEFKKLRYEPSFQLNKFCDVVVF